jgi:shikimate kinase
LALLFLVGPRGCGKSTVARLVARQLGWRVVDADEELERAAGTTIRDIFATEGEQGFRDRESAILSEMCQLDRAVIATGGGVVLREANRQRLREAGAVVWLTADLETLWRRVKDDPSTRDRRPALGTNPAGDSPATMAALLQRREPLYREVAGLTVDTTSRDPQDIADMILAWMSARQGESNAAGAETGG